MLNKLPFRNKVPVRSFTKEYINYKSYKSPLSKDFHNRCGYCGDYDFWSGGPSNYHIDHFAPKSKFKQLENKYANLVYACAYCNRYKSNDWVSDSCDISVVDNKGYIDPCDKSYDNALSRNLLGEILYENEVGKYMYLKMRLFLKRHSIIYKLTTLYELMDKLSNLIEECQLDQNSKENVKNVYIQLSFEFNRYLKYLMGVQVNAREES